MLSMRKFTKKVLLAAVLAASTLSGASMALPVPPAGSVLLVEYYDAFGNQVGAQVHGSDATDLGRAHQQSGIGDGAVLVQSGLKHADRG